MAENVILAETTLSGFVENGGQAALVQVLPMVSGETYTVAWDGVEYACVAEVYEDTDTDTVGVMVENTGALGLPSVASNPNAPFIIIVTPQYGVTSFVALLPDLSGPDMSTDTHTIAIYQGEAETGPELSFLDHAGQPQPYEYAERLRVDTSDGGTTEYVHESLVPVVEDVEIEPDFSGGDMVITPGAGKAFGIVKLLKAAAHIPGNIAEGVELYGETGTFKGGGSAVAKWGQLLKSEETTKVIEHGLGVVPDVVAFFTYSSPGADYNVAGYGFSEPGAALAKPQTYYRTCGFRARTVGALNAAPSNGYITQESTTQAISNATDTTFNLNMCGNAPYYWFAIGGILG